ncbi:cell wall-binding repeat-containing protein [Sutcliffiella cohnii]
MGRGDDFPDALAGAPLAAKLNAPILQTRQNQLREETKQRLLELQPTKVIILGGEGAVSKAVVEDIKKLGVKTVDRISGSNRYATAAEIAKRLGGNPDKAIIAYGRNFPDALSIAPYAAEKGYPILLTNTNALAKEAESALKGLNIKSTYVIGGSTVVSDAILKQTNGKRISGVDRYDTSKAIAEFFNMSSEQVFVASGRDFPDALTGSVLAAKNNAPILLVRNTGVPEPISNYLKKNEVNEFKVLGGLNAVSPNAVNQLNVK